jgi:hypothetical protein
LERLFIMTISLISAVFPPVRAQSVSPGCTVWFSDALATEPPNSPVEAVIVAATPVYRAAFRARGART